MAKTQILHVAVDKTTERMLRQEAKRQDVSLSDILRFAINAYLAATAPKEESSGGGSNSPSNQKAAA